MYRIPERGNCREYTTITAYMRTIYRLHVAAAAPAARVEDTPGGQNGEDFTKKK